MIIKHLKFKLVFKIYTIAVLLLLTFPVFGQFSKEEISTDSSDIVIIRNSVYRVYEETYKYKDLIWYSVRFIKDTNQVHQEGWETKKRKRLGIWQEYTIDGILMYTLDHDKGICEINKEMFPNHEIIEKMKFVADSLIISAYSNVFFENNVGFDFNCFTYDKDGYVGSWLEPLKRKPTEFLFRYKVKIDSSEWYDDLIGIELGEHGEYVPSNDIWNNYGFENVQAPQRTFLLNRRKALEIAKENGLGNIDSGKVSEFLKWENFRKPEFYNGRFKYYITELRDMIKDIKENGRFRIEYKYNVYTFDPWSGEFIEMKKMKKIQEWEKYSGYTSDLMPDE